VKNTRRTRLVEEASEPRRKGKSNQRSKGVGRESGRRLVQFWRGEKGA
jgi:hypothetical protein